MPIRSIPIVMYHHVSPAGKGLNVTPEIFEDQLRLLHKKGWRTLSGEEFFCLIQNNEIPKKCVLLTFDDGFADNYIYAYPLLKKYNMKAILFVSTSFIEDIDIKRARFIPLSHKDAWDLALKGRVSDVMCTWKELREMEESEIFDIQSHSHSHKTPYYIKEKKYPELRNDLLVCKETIEEKLSKDVFHLSWPKGHYDLRAINIATELGYKAIYTTERGTNSARNLKALRRLPVKKDGEWLVNRLNLYSSVFLSKLYLSVRKRI